MTTSQGARAHARGGIAAVDRALVVLLALEGAADGARRTSGARLTDLARETGLALATLTRLLASLEHAGLVRRGPDKRSTLGPTPLRLGLADRRSLRLDLHVQPVLAELGAATQDAASFSVREGAERLCLFRVESTLPVRESVAAGDRLPLAIGAPSRVLRAFTDDDPRDDDVRRRGWAVSLGDRVPELAAVAAPVFGVDPTGRRPTVLVGALSISGLRTRFDGAGLDRRRALVIVHAAALSSALGAVPGPEDTT